MPKMTTFNYPHPNAVLNERVPLTIGQAFDAYIYRNGGYFDQRQYQQQPMQRSSYAVQYLTRPSTPIFKKKQPTSDCYRDQHKHSSVVSSSSTHEQTTTTTPWLSDIYYTGSSNPFLNYNNFRQNSVGLSWSLEDQDNYSTMMLGQKDISSNPSPPLKERFDAYPTTTTTTSAAIKDYSALKQFVMNTHESKKFATIYHGALGFALIDCRTPEMLSDASLISDYTTNQLVDVLRNMTERLVRCVFVFDKGSRKINSKQYSTMLLVKEVASKILW